MFGISLSTIPTVHVLISVIGLLSGVAFVAALLRNKNYATLSAVFLFSSAATSLTGFMFPVTQILPSHIVGVTSLVVLSRWIYIIGAVGGLYLNTFVGVAQAFLKITLLHSLAHNGNEPPFLVAQLALLVVMFWFGYRAVVNFRSMPRISVSSAA
jgi:hypothetical protein